MEGLSEKAAPCFLERTKIVCYKFTEERERFGY